MPSKNDISSLKDLGKKKAILPKAETAEAQPAVASQAPARAGRKPKPPHLKETRTVQIRFTEEEMQALEARAGLIPLATFLKHHLKTQTDFMEPLEG